MKELIHGWSGLMLFLYVIAFLIEYSFTEVTQLDVLKDIVIAILFSALFIGTKDD